MVYERHTAALPHTEIVMPEAVQAQCGGSPWGVKRVCSEREGGAANGSLTTVNGTQFSTQKALGFTCRSQPCLTAGRRILSFTVHLYIGGRSHGKALQERPCEKIRSRGEGQSCETE